MAKKMMLVDANFGTDLRSINRHYSALDQNITNVLERSDLNDFDKLKLYQHALSRFLISKQEVEGEASKPVSVQSAEPTPKKIEDKYLDSLAGDERQKASDVIDDLIAYTPLRWNDEGELLLDRRVLKSSDLTKLVTHELKQRAAASGTSKKSRKTAFTSLPPVGYDTFAKYRAAHRLQSTASPSRRSKQERRQKQQFDSWLTYD
jgi:hypothetical protein